MCTDRTLSDALRAGRRDVDAVTGVGLLDDWAWYDPPGKWALHCRLSISVPEGSPVPAQTDWYVLAAHDYPLGRIKFYPARERGLSGTWPHQTYNSPGDLRLPWREGDLCLDPPSKRLGRQGYTSEPHHEHTRLLWHFERAVEWLEAASRDELLQPGDPFELPHFPTSLPEPAVVFAEGAASLCAWQAVPDMAGFVDYKMVPGSPKRLLVVRYRSLSGRELPVPAWGTALTGVNGEPQKGVWLRLPSVPVLQPWQAPATWGELRQAARLCGVDLDALLKKVVDGVRDGNPHVALIGFPMPEVVGGPLGQMHWQAVQLPAVSRGQQVPDGYRPNRKGYWVRDRREALNNSAGLTWLASGNWHPDHISRRGRMPANLATRRVLLLGAGALGSAVGEVLVRAGVHDIAVLDGEMLQVGNLSRHTLGVPSIGKPKASTLADRLNNASPNAKVTGIDTPFPPKQAAHLAMARACDLVIDCTGSDAALYEMERFAWQDGTLFVSLSVGKHARRVYCFTAHGRTFPRVAFERLIAPWLQKERDEYKDDPLPWEGIGCWSPIFPARSDDIWLLASSAAKYLAEVAGAPPHESDIVVFEQEYADDDQTFLGVYRIMGGGAGA